MDMGILLLSDILEADNMTIQIPFEVKTFVILAPALCHNGIIY